jgi:hypothetical protein
MSKWMIYTLVRVRTQWDEEAIDRTQTSLPKLSNKEHIHIFWKMIFIFVKLSSFYWPNCYCYITGPSFLDCHQLFDKCCDFVELKLTTATEKIVFL